MIVKAIEDCLAFSYAGGYDPLLFLRLSFCLTFKAIYMMRTVFAS